MIQKAAADLVDNNLMEMHVKHDIYNYTFVVYQIILFYHINLSSVSELNKFYNIVYKNNKIVV